MFVVENYCIRGIIHAKGGADMVIFDNNSRASVDMLCHPMVNLTCVLVRDKHKSAILKLLDNVIYTLGRVLTWSTCRVDKFDIGKFALLRLIAVSQ